MSKAWGTFCLQEIVNRPKKGFFSWEYWLKTELKDFCEEHINNISHRDFIHGDALKATWKNFLKGDPTVRWMEVWLFVILDYWMQKNEM
ncbi:MAG: hypothetical protein IPP79_09655 [Chitinophagaceae bacterium]|nr:hypothetical protein [Chitinophagaceae bacterium]